MSVLEKVRLCEIQEVWESFSGWYWFVTEFHPDELAFGLVRGFETEWGYFSLKELRRLRRSLKVWKVPRDHWAFCPCVVVNDGAASYSSASAPWLGKSQGRLSRRGQNTYKEVET